jgi:hypothetical protein
VFLPHGYDHDKIENEEKRSTTTKHRHRAKPLLSTGDDKPQSGIASLMTDGGDTGGGRATTVAPPLAVKDLPTKKDGDLM